MRSSRVPLPVINAAPSDQRARDTAHAVVLIGYQKQANLGLGYLAATLRAAGYRVEVLDFELPQHEILARVQVAKPILIGFSLIFQFAIDEFGAIIHSLRDHGVACHFTMGGHFPSLSYEHTLELLPEIDSVVRFEGEQTLLDLVDNLSTNRDWHDIAGIAYRRDGDIVATPLRPLIHDLDVLPYPDRDFKPNVLIGRNEMPILASRGCARTCSFCSIHMFYRTAPGKVVRTRKPSEVVREMRSLYEKRDITVFLFQDDDFPLFGAVWHRWAQEFVDELHRNDLPGRVIWKINCRADAVEADLFTRMKDAGLFMVYMGLESGSEAGLQTLHKQITVEQNIRAVQVLKDIGVRFEFGFMLFEPSTTFASVQENLRFLRTIVGDGSTAAAFCRMIPYDGTPIKDELLRTGRLRGDIKHPDYTFLDPKVTAFYETLAHIVTVTGWIHGIESLSPQLNYAWSEVAAMERLFPPLPGLAAYKDVLREITAASNELLFRVVEDTSAAFTDRRASQWSTALLKQRCSGYLAHLVAERNAFVRQNQATLLSALSRELSAYAVSG